MEKIRKTTKIKEVVLGSGAATTPSQRIFGANKLEINEEGASNLIGAIVERGISENSSFAPVPAPRPSVFPFPVARHRAHGPHWNPIRGRDDKDAEDKNEDNDRTDFDPISSFANPVQRKQKRGLNFGQWKESVSKDTSLEAVNKMETNGYHPKKKGENQMKKNLNGASRKIDVDSVSGSSPPSYPVEMNKLGDNGAGFFTSPADMEIDNSQHSHIQHNAGYAGDSNISNAQLNVTYKIDTQLLEMHTIREQEHMSAVSVSTTWDLGNERGQVPPYSDIDAENCEKLQSMSTEEIAEAQAEIMQKWDPSRVAFLKSRGASKKKSLLRPTLPTNGQLADTVNSQLVNTQCENQSLKDSNNSQAQIDSLQKTNVRAMENEGNLGPGNSDLWNSWSERVEAVRDLRFSLEGAVVADVYKNGHSSYSNWHCADNGSERDFLRTEGDPAAAGYTIKEAIQLTRSVIPGQRGLSLHLIASVLDNAIHNVQQKEVGCSIGNVDAVDKSIDWEAIWAYALGPEPELVLSLRICLDDNHDSVVIACLKVIQSVLTCNLNENFFRISEKFGSYEKCIFNAPVFRTKPEINAGFLRGGFWKYSAKPSTILTLSEDITDHETEGKHTIQDDIVVAGQDFAAGLVRMGILPRMHYLLESNPTAALEEYIISILLAIARHSPTCSDAIMKCQRLVDTVVCRFTMGEDVEIHPSKVKCVRLLKVLAQSKKTNCMEFINNGYFQRMTWHLYRPASSIDQWVKLGKENCKLLSSLMVEQLHFWKVCISYGCCLSYFPSIFPALCVWLSPPTFEKLQEKDLLAEYTSISAEGYLVLEALARKLTNLHTKKLLESQMSDDIDDEEETWSWNYVTPLVGLALKWIASKNNPCISKIFDGQMENGTRYILNDLPLCSLLWVYSAIMKLLSTLLGKVKPEDDGCLEGKASPVPWLPEFVPKVGLEIIKHGFLSFSNAGVKEYRKDFTGSGSFVEKLCCLRQQSEKETSLASVCCLYGILETVASIDNLIPLAKAAISGLSSDAYSSSSEGKILEDGIQRGSMVELENLQNVLMRLISLEWSQVQSIEIFGRGGPAPGVGVGWGALDGGFWSTSVLLAQKDAKLLIHRLGGCFDLSSEESNGKQEMVSVMHRINSVLEVCLICGPRDRVTLGKAFDVLFQVHSLKHLAFCIKHFLQSKGMKLFGWEYKEEEYLLLGRMLSSHYKNRWLSVKRKSKPLDQNNFSGKRVPKKGLMPLNTIDEDIESNNTDSEDHHCHSLAAEWAHQRLPLPLHWLLSPIATIVDNKQIGPKSVSGVPNLVEGLSDIVEIAKSGLFFLLGTEAMSSVVSTDAPSPIRSIPLIWKLHALSVSLLLSMGVLEDDKSRDIFEALQDHYGQLSSTQSSKYRLFPETTKKVGMEFLRFQSEIHESYATFVETLVEQFAAISYGDTIFGRQVALYLLRCTEGPVRIAAWNALSNAHALEILPPLDCCISEAKGYLEPIEDSDGVLEAYVKSWVSGALDRAASRGSMAFKLVLHHVSSFIFTCASDKKLLRNKLVKSLLRDYAQKDRHEGMMLDFVRYNKPSTSCLPEEQSNMVIEKRFEVLGEACDIDSSLLKVVEKLKYALAKEERAVN